MFCSQHTSSVDFILQRFIHHVALLKVSLIDLALTIVCTPCFKLQIMAAIIAATEIHSLKEIDTKLCELGYSEADIWAIKWLIKNILLTSFLVSRFYLQRYIDFEPILKWTMMWIVLIVAWLPCLKAYPILSVVLMCLNAFLLSVGPLSSIPILCRTIYRNFGRDPPDDISLNLLGGYRNFTFWPFGFYLYIRDLQGYGPVDSMHERKCVLDVLAYAGTVYLMGRRENERRRALGTQEEALAAIRLSMIRNLV